MRRAVKAQKEVMMAEALAGLSPSMKFSYSDPSTPATSSPYSPCEAVFLKKIGFYSYVTAGSSVYSSTSEAGASASMFASPASAAAASKSVVSFNSSSPTAGATASFWDMRAVDWS